MRQGRVCYACERSRTLADRTNPPPPGNPPAAAAGIGKLATGVHAMRRGGARREVTERVTLRSPDGRILEGWALNVSRGGLRAILEEKVILGQRFDVGVGSDDTIHRQGRIVWVQEEPDGVIVGIEFTGLSGTHKSAPPPPPGAQTMGPDDDEPESK